MKFGDFWKDDSPANEAPAGETPMLPDGTHVGTIGHVSMRNVEWKKSDANPEGLCLNLRVDVTGYQAAWDDIPAQMRNIIEAVCRSCRVHLPAPDEDWDCQTLKGQTVTIETISGISKGGRPYVRISKYRPSNPPLPKELAKPAAVKPKAKAKEPVPTLTPDDIPF